MVSLFCTALIESLNQKPQSAGDQPQSTEATHATHRKAGGASSPSANGEAGGGESTKGYTAEQVAAVKRWRAGPAGWAGAGAWWCWDVFRSRKAFCSHSSTSPREGHEAGGGPSGQAPQAPEYSVGIRAPLSLPAKTAHSRGCKR